MFDEKFFEAAGLGEFSEEQKQQIAMKLAELVQQRLAIRLADELDDEQAENFSKLIDSGQEEQAFKYLETAYPGYADAMAQEIERARGELLADMQVAAEHLKDE
jgi:hypothetical protein